MAQEITRQADYFGLPQPERSPAPPIEHVAEQLAAPQPWQGPAKIAGDSVGTGGEGGPNPYAPPKGTPGWDEPADGGGGQAAFTPGHQMSADPDTMLGGFE